LEDIPRLLVAITADLRMLQRGSLGASYQ